MHIPQNMWHSKKFKVWNYLISSTLKYVSDLIFGTEWKLGSGARMGGTEEPLLFQQELRLSWMTKTKKLETQSQKQISVWIFYPQFDVRTCYHFRFQHRSNLWLSLVTLENWSISYRCRAPTACIYLWWISWAQPSSIIVSNVPRKSKNISIFLAKV